MPDDRGTTAPGELAGHLLSLTDLIAQAERLKAAGQSDKAATLYRQWIAFNNDHPLLYAAAFNFGITLGDVGDPWGGIMALRDAIRSKPDFYPPYINLGGFFERMGLADRAVAEWRGITDQLPSVHGDSVLYKTMALKQIGRVLESAQNDEAAEDALRQSLEINPEQTDVFQHWIALRQRQCKWPVIAAVGQAKVSKVVAAISPLSLACHADDPIFQLANAYTYNRKSIGIPDQAPIDWSTIDPAARKPGPLRIGYVSSDFREHAVGFSMTDVLGLHDRARTEIFAYYCGIKTVDSTQLRIREATDHWCDISQMDDAAASAQIRNDAIDILIDLNGYTKDARTKLFALRPAPVNVNWFGFPGTMGSPYHHYIVADETIVPQSHERFYSEKVLRLECYQPNDRHRVVAPHRPQRADENLPEGAFVFCCLNGMQKLTPSTFGRWMQILSAVPDSVLWLLSATPDTNERLRQQAQQSGIAPERLIFAQKKANPYHLARYVLADLFLDNTPYGAHTTAADAMWMGVPILTKPGRSFASRVCASLVTAAGIPEMICASPEDYVTRAIELGSNPAMVAELKRKLAENRATCALFDTPKLVRDLESLYETMWRDFIEGRLPKPDLRNLDVYQEAAIELDLPAMEIMPDGDYERLYVEAMKRRDAVYPIAPDARLWT
ncbi:MAG: glycosyl transferase [Hyphomicrobiales bacterium]|nr:glycosyl transferase [Hyphomicrobiales bacterium]